MGASPKYKVYGPDKRYKAACKDIEAAACLVSFYGDGATIKANHSLTVWKEGERRDGLDGFAYVSYDRVADVAEARERQWNERIFKTVYTEDRNG